jgi:hypothetical protein
MTAENGGTSVFRRRNFLKISALIQMLSLTALQQLRVVGF